MIFPVVNSTILDTKYIRLLSPKLEKYREKGKGLYNFRCPICGDSSTSNTKARGYLFPYKGSLVYKCHNCAQSMAFSVFLKLVDSNLYQSYQRERFNHPAIISEEEVRQKLVDKPIALYQCLPLTKLNLDHPVKQYSRSRGIPTRYDSILYATEDFWNVISHYYETAESKNIESRLVIPFFTASKTIFAFQGRSLNPKSKLRYVTIKLDKAHPKIYGLERVNRTQKVYCVEGPIDSLFLPNAVAMAGIESQLLHEFLNIDRSLVTYVFDNEPRNPEIIRFMSNVVDKGYNLFIWPSEISPGTVKDINDLASHGLTQSQLSRLIDKYTYNSLSAKTKLSEWRRS